VIAFLVIATMFFAFAIATYIAMPKGAWIIIGALSALAAVLAVSSIELLKQRNIQRDAARAAKRSSRIWMDRAAALNRENWRLFNVYCSHLPVEVVVQSLAAMAREPIRIHGVGPETDWYRIATSATYRHLFDQDDLKALEGEANGQEDADR
jgi:hypothetical protein